MKEVLRRFLISSVCLLSLVSCGIEDDADDMNEGSADSELSCKSTSECPIGFYCNTERKICVNSSDDNSDSGSTGSSGSGDSTDSESSSGSGDSESESGNSGSHGSGSCEPGETKPCEYQGLPETENVGPCKAAEKTCKDDGTWGACKGEVLPIIESDELCHDGIDNDCDGNVDNGTDFDKDGFGICEDCCETTEQCPDPASAWDINNPNHACKYEEIEYECDSGLSEGSISSADYGNAVDYAKAIGICKTTTKDSNSWGLISAKISAPNGNKTVHDGSNGLLSAFGNVIKPKKGSFMLALTSSKLGNPITDPDYSGGTTSAAPQDWLDKNGNQYPAAPSCPKSGRTGTVYDAVMLTLEIKTPSTAKSFSFNIYFITKEYPNYICSDYNDFFIALLDSEYTSDNPELQNPADKNLAMDSLGNPVGINLAPAGLFTQCENYPGKGVTSCIGKEELQGTGFASNGGTGWLTTSGNVVGGEIITLRLAIWDLKDHWYDSIVLIDNFRWDVTEQKPGTSM